MSTSPLKFGEISNFGQLTPWRLDLRQSRAKIMRLFIFRFISVITFPLPPPYTMMKKNI